MSACCLPSTRSRPATHFRVTCRHRIETLASYLRRLVHRQATEAPLTEPPVVRGPAPQSPFMSASEVLTWIAFGVPEKHAWKDQALDRLLVALPSVHAITAMDLLLQAGTQATCDTPELQAALSELQRAGDRKAALRQAVSVLIGAVGRGKICAYGIEDGFGIQRQHEPIDSMLFMDSSVTVTLNDRVQQGADMLKEGIDGKPGYRLVRFVTDEVLAIWPSTDRVDLEATASSIPSGEERRRTGTAGRPSSKALVTEKMRLRAAQGHLAPTLAEEARYLCAWLLSDHPNEAQPQERSLINSIRAEYRQLRSA